MLDDNTALEWWQVLLIGALLFLAALGNAVFLRWVTKAKR